MIDTLEITVEQYIVSYSKECFWNAHVRGCYEASFVFEVVFSRVSYLAFIAFIKVSC